MKVIGITGSSGSGKTTVSEILNKRNDVKVINADKMAKQFTSTESAYLEEIKKVFENDNILFENGELNRRALANLIYSNNQKLQLLNSITFKHLIPKIVNEIKDMTNFAKFVIIDAPLLFEAGLDKYCDFTVSVQAPNNLKVERICARDNIDEKTAKSRLKIQKSNEFYAENADYIIINDENTTLEELEQKINEIIKYK